MIENDIPFDKLSGAEFEEMCYDLLVAAGYHSLVWRQGGADNGRDIEAHRAISNPLIESYSEKWFIECKNHKAGIDVNEISSKVAWARAEKPEHLLIIVTSYLTTQAREWLKKAANKSNTDATFTTHLIEGKQLKSLLLSYPDIVTRYFLSEHQKLLKAAIHAWVKFDILPSASTLFTLHENLDPDTLTINDIAFLIVAYNSAESELEIWMELNTFFSYEDWLPVLAERMSAESSRELFREVHTTMSLGVGKNSWDDFDLYHAKVRLQRDDVVISGIYLLLVDEYSVAFEFLMPQEEDCTCLVSMFMSDKGQQSEIVEALHGSWHREV